MQTCKKLSGWWPGLSVFKECYSNYFLFLCYPVLREKLSDIFRCSWIKSIIPQKVKVCAHRAMFLFFNSIFQMQELAAVTQLLHAVKWCHLIHKNPITVTEVNFPATYLTFWSLVAQRWGLRLSLADELKNLISILCSSCSSVYFSYLHVG